MSSGLGYCWLKRHHPAWLLASAQNGRPLKFSGYPAVTETDYGDPGYQRQWLRNVLADVRAHGWDGVEVDNALATAGAYGVAAKYPTDSAVQAATFSALHELGPSLHRAGVRSVFNVGYATRFPALWQRWLGPVDGLEQEFYLSYGTTPTAVDDSWRAYEAEISRCAVLHKTCWFHSGAFSSAVTSQTRDYALASYLLATDGQQLLSVGSLTSLPGCLEPGRPTGPVKGSGPAWRRSFTRGIVVTNPTSSAVSVPLGGTFVDASGRSRSAVALGPASGAVLGAKRLSPTPTRDACPERP